MMLINPRYLEYYEEEITQPEIISVEGNCVTYIGTGEDEISLPFSCNAEVGPRKKVKVTKWRVKPEYAYLPLVELLG